jgi:hypothetical protein
MLCLAPFRSWRSFSGLSSLVNSLLERVQRLSRASMEISQSLYKSELYVALFRGGILFGNLHHQPKKCFTVRFHCEWAGQCVNGTISTSSSI